MALHPDFPNSPHAILDPKVRWFPADEALRETSMDKLMPPLVATLRKKVKEFRDSGYVGAAETSKSLLNWWFKESHGTPLAPLVRGVNNSPLTRGEQGGVGGRLSILLRPARGPGNHHLSVRCGGGKR